MYKPLAESTCQFISTLDDLVALNEKLARMSAFAVDLEVRLFQACMMRFSRVSL